MESILMHKNAPAAIVQCNGGKIEQLEQVVNPAHMPAGTCAPGMQLILCDRYLKAWQASRMVPADRINLPAAIRRESSYELSAMGHGQNVMDTYWFCPEQEDLSWDEVNFHSHPFPASLRMLTGHGTHTPSPDYDTNGALPKAWSYYEGKLVLIKDAPDWLPTASANEVVAYRIAQACGVPHAEYFPVTIGKKVYAASTCFTDGETELVTLQMYRRTHRGDIREAMHGLGLDDNFIDTMTAFDLLVGNTDRHEGNVGILINPDSPSFSSPAPLYDSGTCLHKQFWDNGIFKPVYFSEADAFARLEHVPFPIPSYALIRAVIASVYDEFGLGKYAGKAIEEMCRNALLLRKISEKE